ncbi:MAG: LTA synthase family protein [Flavobacteriaceae bacterium]|nr:LTA synthase family protein [Flavobacteriaceae bacterium]
MKNTFRLGELKLLAYRLLLAYFFYFIARLLFVLYNNHLIQIDDFSSFLDVSLYGLAFDTAALMYLNALFILASFLPLVINTRPNYQKVVFYLYFIPNLLGYALNFVDFGYYPFSQSRTTILVTNELENERNTSALFLHFLKDFWHIFLLFFLLAFLWIWLYKKIRLPIYEGIQKKSYILASILMFLLIPTLMIGGIRGDFKYSTRPITLVDASRHVKKPTHADAVLNTPFAFIRTINKTQIKRVNFVSQATIDQSIRPRKQYAKDSTKLNKPNVIIFILESFGREYWGAFNQHKNITDYKSYTPFLDKLAAKGLVFPNSYANGRKSIHGMSSVLSGIPSFKVAYTSSSFSNQPTSSLVSELNQMGYDTSFFHGAPNGSMGFLGYSTILGFDHYYGKNEYNNDADFDGIWGIWDEPFLQYMKEELDKKQGPFMATVFTVSSHDPFKVPQQYQGKFPKGDIPMHQVIGYTDHALQKFFEAAQKEDWYDNTIFVFTADHVNQIHYKHYSDALNRFAVPILFYHPSEKYQGTDLQLAQQIDIFPTIMDMIGYQKPFRSWGRSLLNDKDQAPFVMTSSGNVYYFMEKDYTCVFDGKNSIGFYAAEDLALSKNLIANKNQRMQEIETRCKAFIQDYMARITQRNMKPNYQ